MCFSVRQGDEWSCTRRFSAVFRYDDDVDDETSATRFHESLKRLINRQHEQVADSMLPMFNFELPSSFGGCFPVLMAHCNGILCFTDHKSILLVNPSLKEMKTFPISVLDTSYDSIYCKSVGFGFDNITMDFKVVTILRLKHWASEVAPRQIAQVYRVTSRVWRKLDVLPDDYTSLRCSTFFNGEIHWCAKTTQHSGWRILTFNMVTELFEEKKFPEGAKDIAGLFVLNQDSLALVSYPYPFRMSSSDFVVDVWTMNKHRGETEVETTWTKLYSIENLNLFQTPICLWKNHKLFYLSTTGGKMISYDLLDRSSFVVWDNVSPFWFRSYDEFGGLFKVDVQLGLCKSSLVSVNT